MKISTMTKYIAAHIAWSVETFGDGMRTAGLCKHIEKELDEIRAAPNDVMEWVDVIILALDGAWRAGYSAGQIAAALQEKQRINIAREWFYRGDDEPIEHARFCAPPPVPLEYPQRRE